MIQIIHKCLVDNLRVEVIAMTAEGKAGVCIVASDQPDLPLDLLLAADQHNKFYATRNVGKPIDFIDADRIIMLMDREHNAVLPPDAIHEMVQLISSSTGLDALDYEVKLDPIGLN